ncbi:MAG: hypothetical protein IT459_22645 [Planctomycetes bacterium]|nr:hypothetical protein [Planctomycetota bacterium]
MQHDEAKRIAEQKIAAAIAEYEERTARAVQAIELEVGELWETKIDDPPHAGRRLCARIFTMTPPDSTR